MKTKIKLVAFGLMFLTMAVLSYVFLGKEDAARNLEGRAVVGTGYEGGVHIGPEEDFISVDPKLLDSTGNTCGSTNGVSVTGVMLNDLTLVNRLLNNLCSKMGTQTNFVINGASVTWNCGSASCSATIQ